MPQKKRVLPNLSRGPMTLVTQARDFVWKVLTEGSLGLRLWSDLGVVLWGLKVHRSETAYSFHTYQYYTVTGTYLQRLEKSSTNTMIENRSMPLGPLCTLQF